MNTTRILLAVICSALAACGGGGDESVSVASPASRVPVFESKFTAEASGVAVVHFSAKLRASEAGGMQLASVVLSDDGTGGNKVLADLRGVEAGLGEWQYWFDTVEFPVEQGQAYTARALVTLFADGRVLEVAEPRITVEVR